MMLREKKDDKHFLNVHLDNSLANQRSAKKSPEGDEEMATCDAGQVKQRVRNRRRRQNAKEAHSVDQVVHEKLASRHHIDGSALIAVFLRVEQLLELVQILVILIVSTF